MIYIAQTSDKNQTYSGWSTFVAINGPIAYIIIFCPRASVV